MNRILGVLLLAVATSCSALPSSRPIRQAPGEDRDVTTISALAGLRTLSDSDFWDPLDDTNTIGIEVDHYSVDDWVGFELGAQLSNGDETGAELKFSEIYAGVRKTFELNSFLRPYVSFGLTYLQAQAALDLDSQGPFGTIPVAFDDESLGVYGRLGMLFSVTESITLGLEYRHVLLTDLDISGGPFTFDKTDGDYGQFGFTLGYSF